MTDTFKTIQTLLATLKSDNRAVTALEYGLIAAVLGAVVVTAFTGLGTSLTSAITKVSSSL